jgi:hypothetical protein
MFLNAKGSMVSLATRRSKITLNRVVFSQRVECRIACQSGVRVRSNYWSVKVRPRIGNEEPH